LLKSIYLLTKLNIIYSPVEKWINKIFDLQTRGKNNTLRLLQTTWVNVAATPIIWLNQFTLAV